ncbi:MAG: DUF3592 domain-containing protein [Candidatus Thermoplasmatota archaeon]
MGKTIGPKLSENKKFFTFLAILLIVISLVATYFTYGKIKKDIDSLNWDNTDGKITHSEVVRERVYDRDSVNKYTYSAYVQYEYQVGNKTYTSDTVSFGGKGFSSSDKGYAEGIVDKYPEGENVTVHYNPDKPSEAVLEPGLNIMSIIPIIFGVVLLIVGIAILYFLYVRKSVVGSIDISLRKRDYMPGDTIKGSLSLHLKKPVDAEGLTVSFKAEKKVRYRQYGQGFGRYRTQSFVVVENKKKLDADKSYQVDSYPFELTIPSDVLRKVDNWTENVNIFSGDEKSQNGAAGMMQRFITERINQAPSSQVRDVFLVEAHLDIPRKVDIKKRVKINVKGQS